MELAGIELIIMSFRTVFRIFNKIFYLEPIIEPIINLPLSVSHKYLPKTMSRRSLTADRNRCSINRSPKLRTTKPRGKFWGKYTTFTTYLWVVKRQKMSCKHCSRKRSLRLATCRNELKSFRSMTVQVRWFKVCSNSTLICRCINNLLTCSRSCLRRSRARIC